MCCGKSGKILLTHFNVDSLKESLAINLPRIGVKGAGFTCSIIAVMMPFSDCHGFEYYDGNG